MKKRNELSLAERLFSWLKRHPDEWFNGGELEELSIGAGYKGSTGSRELRLLAELGRIEREERTNHNTGTRSVWYRWSKEGTDEQKRVRLVRWFDRLQCSCQKCSTIPK